MIRYIVIFVCLVGSNRGDLWDDYCESCDDYDLFGFCDWFCEDDDSEETKPTTPCPTLPPSTSEKTTESNEKPTTAATTKADEATTPSGGVTTPAGGDAATTPTEATTVQG
nr:platelet glycoprotein Ib alpha chain-like [Onthophagus taurus]